MRRPVICPALEPNRTELALIREGLSRRAPSRDWEQPCQQVLAAWEPLIRWLARRYAPHSSCVLDFAQIGRMTLLRAALKFPPGYPGRFEHYVRRALRNALVDEAKRVQSQRRERQLERDCFSCEDSALDRVIHFETRDLVKNRVERWLPRLRRLVEMLYVEDLSQADAARALGLTPARISQLCRDLRRLGQIQFEDLADLVG
ncbi:MAG: sigma-70 family RNA polymerase sigma factor [Gemmataceae bacterium]